MPSLVLCMLLLTCQHLQVIFAQLWVGRAIMLFGLNCVVMPAAHGLLKDMCPCNHVIYTPTGAPTIY